MLMHVHHLNYKHCKNNHVWECLDEDLVTLCEDCHNAVHSGAPYKKSAENYNYLKSIYEILRDIKRGSLIVYYEETKPHVFLNRSYINNDFKSLNGIDFYDNACHYPHTIDFNVKGFLYKKKALSVIEVIPQQAILSKLVVYISNKAGWLAEIEEEEENTYENDLVAAFYHQGITIESVEYWYAPKAILSLESFKLSETIPMLEVCLGNTKCEEAFSHLSTSMKVDIAAKALSLVNIIKEW